MVRMPKSLVAIVFTALLLLPGVVLAADNNKGPIKGAGLLKVSEDLAPGDAVYYKLTSNFSENATIDPVDTTWNFPATGSITLRFLNATSGGTPPARPDNTAGDLFMIELYYDNYTAGEHFIRPIYGGTMAPLNNTNITLRSSGDIVRTQTVDSTDSKGKYSSIWVVNESVVFSSYMKELTLNHKLFIANTTNGGKDWRTQEVDGIAGGGNGFTSITAPNASTVFVSYHSSSANLKVANSSDGGVSWRTREVDALQVAHTSIEAPNTSTIFVSYQETGGGDLKFANSTDGGLTWRTQTVDSANNVGPYTSLHAVNHSVIYISYQYTTDDDLRVANSTDGGRTWRLQDVDTGGIVGLWTSIDGIKDTIYISYYDSTNTNLRLAKSTNAGSTWTTSTVDSAGDVGEYTSIYVKNESVVYVTYYDSTSDNLKLAKSTDGGSTWNFFLLDTGSDVGQYTSISGVNDTIYVSYYDATNADLKVAKIEDVTLPKSGTFRLKIRSVSATAGVEDYDANTDSGLASGTVTFDANYTQGFIRANLKVTNFTVYKDSAYTQNETRFMRNETVYMEFFTDAASWNNTGIEHATLELQGPGGNATSVRANITHTNNTYRASWVMPLDASLNNYDVDLRITGYSTAYETPYEPYIADNQKDLIISNGSTITLDGTSAYRNVVLSNNSKIAVGSGGNLTLRADGTIRIESGSAINATAVGDNGGAGGPGGETCADGGNGATGSGSGGGGGGTYNQNSNLGSGGGGGGHGGSGGAGGAGGGAAGSGGGTHGSATDRTTKKGSGGGGGASACAGNPDNLATGGGAGGNGGGTVVLEADGNITISGIIDATGDKGTSGIAFNGAAKASSGGGGGGAGGTIVLNATSVVLTGTLQAKGGNGGDSPAASDGSAGGSGGGGGAGRVKIFATDVDSRGTITVTAGVGGATEGSGGVGGANGTNNTYIGVTWTAFNSTGVGFKSERVSNFSTTTFTDPDGVLPTRNATFWVEEELQLIHDYGPRLNFSNTSTIQQYLMRGDVLNYSFVVLDEWNRTFASKEVNVSINTTTYERNVSTATTASTGRLSGTILLANDTPNSYNNATPAQLETRDYAIHGHFPSTAAAATLGSYGENDSQEAKFDVSSKLFADTHVQNTSTLNKDNMDDSNEQLTYKINNETVRVWVHVQNVRAEDQNGKNVTTWAYSSEGSRSSPTATFTGTTGTDGWTALLGSLLATTPAGSWFFDSDVGPDSGNSTGTDKEEVSFLTKGVNLVGRVFNWGNGTATSGANITATIFDGLTELATLTNTTDSSGKFDILLDVTLLNKKEYTINITATKGSIKSYLTQRFRS